MGNLRRNTGHRTRDRIVVVLAVLISQAAMTLETDQFMVWDIELQDSAPALNEFFNAEVQSFVDFRNDAIENDCSCPEFAEDIFAHFFSRRRTSLIKTFVRESEDVERYPDPEISSRQYRLKSIYRKLTFPYVVPLARTVRVGDVYAGVDKIGHMFGFGPRYYKRYLRHIRWGATEQEALDRVLRWAIAYENTVVGMYFDGVFSHADMEANYQGFLLAKDMCEGEQPYLRRVDDQWEFTRPIDLREYFTPEFDESYNLCHWWADRKREILPILQEEYAHELQLPAVQARFEKYRQHEPSYSKKFLDTHFEKKGKHPQHEQSQIAFDAPPPSARVVGDD